MTNTDNVREILSNDPFSIKKSLINLVDKHLGVKNPDIYEVSFLGYLIQSLTFLTSDVLFNNSLAWNEAFTHLLTLPSSLENHANMLGYTLKHAEPCTGYITVFVPVPENGNYQLTLKNGTVCSGNTQYLIKNTYFINVYSNNNAKIQKKDELTGIISDIEYQTRISSGDKLISFLADVWQIDITTFTEKFTGVQYKQFYDVNIGGIKDNFHSINIGVYVDNENFTVPRLMKFNKVDNIYSCTSEDKAYTFKYYGDGRGTIRFGNGVFGYQPKEGTNANILVYSTKGREGIAYENSIILSTKLTDFYSGEQISIFGTNLSRIDNGKNEENIETAKNAIIANISSAKRLVSLDDYNNFESITNTQNLELYPMILRRDSNANEIDLFSIMYDENGKPVPTNNINYIVDNNKTLLSKDFIYKLAIKSGDNGCELIPNITKVINKNAFSYSSKVLYTATYIDMDYENYIEYEDIDLSKDKKIRMVFNDGSIEYVNPDYVKEFICPFNLSIEDKYNAKVGIFEYIPTSLTNIPQLENQIEYLDIDMSLNSVQFDFDPISSMNKSNIIPNRIRVINNLNISDTVDPDKVTGYIQFIRDDGDEIIKSDEYPCSCKFYNIESNEMQTECYIPVSKLLEGTIKFEYTLYYDSRYYNTYSKNIIFKNKYEDLILTNYIGFPISFKYNPSDESTKQPEPAIDKIYMSVTNININWNSWINEDDSNSTIEGYIVDVQINKLESVDVNKIQVTFDIGYDNQTYYPIDSPAIYNNITCIYSFRIPYNPSYIMNGHTHYKINLNYTFKELNESTNSNNRIFYNFATYSGYATFRKNFSDLMYCNIEKLTNDKYKIYRIPVIEKEFYENNRQYVEDQLLYQLVELDNNTINYKMLTNRMNFKFAKTIGVTENIKYNDFVENIDDSLKYNGWVCDLPPKINISVLVRRDSERNRTDIVNECKEVVLTFLTLKASFNAKIIKSELARYLHETVTDVISCEIIEPSRDIIYFFNEQELPKDKDVLLSYTPEFLYIDSDKITITIKQMPV